MLQGFADDLDNLFANIGTGIAGSTSPPPDAVQNAAALTEDDAIIIPASSEQQPEPVLQQSIQ